MIVVESLGVQVCTMYWWGYSSSLFLPHTIIGDIIINEAITMVTNNSPRRFHSAHILSYHTQAALVQKEQMSLGTKYITMVTIIAHQTESNLYLRIWDKD